MASSGPSTDTWVAITTCKNRQLILQNHKIKRNNKSPDRVPAVHRVSAGANAAILRYKVAAIAHCKTDSSLGDARVFPRDPASPRYTRVPMGTAG